MLVAIVWGVGGVACCTRCRNWLVEKLSPEWTQRLQPFVFVGPGWRILAWFLAIPTMRTLVLSLQDETGTRFRRSEQLHLCLHRPGHAGELSATTCCG